MQDCYQEKPQDLAVPHPGIALRSCFSTLGSRSLGQKLAYVLNKKVIAYLFSTIETFMNHEAEWMAKAKILETNKLVLTDKQHLRNMK
ncbi:hypothetical protein [Arsenophonus nasoniae]|uniref:hypothetical protein n=1 Tax=Arsenophonus nasoniae TaxID=638 RepID=UPI00387915D8